jgi:trk system potassium uptake protein TrkH
MSAPSFFVASFASLIMIGTAGLLWLPGLYAGPGLGLLDALFTATSAVCVTGLIVVDTATYFTSWGQLWILLLFQLGGIGLITLTTAIIGAMGKRLSLRTEMTSVSGVHRDGAQAIWQLARRVARFTLTVELVAALALFLLWLPRFSAPRALWHAVFQSVSAFCNAGFSTFSDSLVQFDDSPATLLIMSALIIAGGFGFLTIGELARTRSSSRRRPCWCSGPSATRLSSGTERSLGSRRTTASSTRGLRRRPRAPPGSTRSTTRRWATPPAF